MEYQIVSGTDFGFLEKQVKDLMREGWIPLGGVAATHVIRQRRDGFTGEEDDFTLYQAMTKGS